LKRAKQKRGHLIGKGLRKRNKKSTGSWETKTRDQRLGGGIERVGKSITENPMGGISRYLDFKRRTTWHHLTREEKVFDVQGPKSGSL